MKRIQSYCVLGILALSMVTGCSLSPVFQMFQKTKTYGEESRLFLPGEKRQVWAVAPTVNLSGVSQVDPLLSSDVVYQQLQQVDGLTVLPVNRVAEVYASLKIDKVQSESQALAICDLLGCDALVVPTITIYDPYDPPKLGASLQLFVRPGAVAQLPPIDPRQLERAASASELPVIETPRRLIQAVGMFDAADGSIRQRAQAYAVGRSDPNGPMGHDVVFLNMECYSGFVYHALIAELLDDLVPGRS
jgi:hypothetical protein